MRRFIFVAILATLLVFGMPSAALAQEPGEGTINGQVVNGTEGGGSVAGVKVVLITYADDTIAETGTAITDDEGQFRFDNIPLDDEHLVTARYMGVDYYYPVVFEPGEKTTYVEFGVCDATTSDQAIRIGMAHTVMDVEEDSLEITEVYWLVNDGDMTYVGTDGVLVFTLPEGAIGFEAPEELMPDYQLLDNNRVTYLVPFPPGERQLVYSYRLVKPDSDEFTIPLEISYPTDSYELMVGGEEIEVTVTQLAPAEPVFTSEGERFIHFWGEDLPRGTVINIQLSNLSENGSLLLTALWIIIAVVIVGIIFYLLKKRRRGKTNE
jgi:hypothetical protein